MPNANGPIDSTLSGISIFSSAEQPLNAPPAIDLRFFESFTSLSFLQSLNVIMPICSTLSGIVTLSISVPLKLHERIPLTPSLMSTFFTVNSLHGAGFSSSYPPVSPFPLIVRVKVAGSYLQSHSPVLPL